MTIEEKAQLYDGAIKVAMSKIKNSKDHVLYEEDITDIFPELKESEGERIRNFLIDFIKVCSWTEKKDQGWPLREECIAWLEKQGGSKSTYNVEPKFKVGDWVVDEDDNSVHQIKRVIENITNGNFSYDLIGGGYFPSIKKNYHLWSIKDAKKGDVIYLPNGNNEYYFFIFKGIENAAVMSFAHFYQYNDGTFEVKGTIDGLFSVNDVFQPATKEQRDTLMKAMSDAGYTFDFEKKELKKNWNKNPILSDFFKAEYEREKADGQKLAEWSEDDEEIVESLNVYVKNLDIFFSEIKIGDKVIISKEFRGKVQSWLKSLKDRVQPQQEWSEEDEQYFNFLEKLLVTLQVKSTENEIKKGTNSNSEYYYKVIQWLKSLRPQKQWKPTEIQIAALENAANDKWHDKSILKELLEQLKQL